MAVVKNRPIKKYTELIPIVRGQCLMTTFTKCDTPWKNGIHFNFRACTNFTKKSAVKPFHESQLARMIGYAIIALLIFIVILKLTGYDGGKIPWSNVYFTTFFALVYLFFVFFPWQRK